MDSFLDLFNPSLENDGAPTNLNDINGNYVTTSPSPPSSLDNYPTSKGLYNMLNIYNMLK